MLTLTSLEWSAGCVPLTCIWYSRTGISLSGVGPNCFLAAEYLQKSHTQHQCRLHSMLVLEKVVDTSGVKEEALNAVFETGLT